MKQFWFKSERTAGKWVIEQRDVRRSVLLANGVEYTLRFTDVGLLYVCDPVNGDRLEAAPQEQQDESTD